MLRLNSSQRAVLTEKLPDVANLGVGALLFGQFVGDRPFSALLAVAGSSARYQVSKDGGHHPLWAPDGNRLFFLEDGGNRLMVVSVQTKPSVVFGIPTMLVDEVSQPLPQARNYDITPDGKRLLVRMIEERSDPRAQEVDVVLNWSEELKQKVPR